MEKFFFNSLDTKCEYTIIMEDRAGSVGRSYPGVTEGHVLPFHSITPAIWTIFNDAIIIQF